ncbi:MAG: response regulator [Planctomycetaceae bacterium]|nr:response regulator [Planctomycetaceae bacterium]
MAAHEILIVDPDKIEVQLVSQQLKELGYAPLWAADIDEAFVILNARAIVAVLCNYALPSGNGVEFLKQIRQHERFLKLPVLLMTHAASSRIVHEAKEQGVSDFVLKPLDANRIRKALAMFIAKGPAPA